ncbi:hypothetical protein [Paraburkholderia pallida]|uniref:Uncharacterized protein n=1 Tax=Paraburkholderia pallida TaxID=2547399 RepID=A0A4V1B0Q7_9BURK|nr:hypothetical protein [Paraburkholderia pallida]QBR03613.1 hypothetical protein E1956_41620 [Paraburkholderia pallida]
MQDLQTQLPQNRPALQLNEHDADADFVDGVRKTTSLYGGKAACIANVAKILTRELDTTEKCIVVVLTDVASEDIDYQSQAISTQVRRTDDGFPIACALLANGRIAVSAQAVNLAQPLDCQRLHVLWVFRDKISFQQYPYTEQTEEDLWVACCVADGHRHEYDPTVNVDDGIIDVRDYFAFR